MKYCDVWLSDLLKGSICKNYEAIYIYESLLLLPKSENKTILDRFLWSSQARFFVKSNRCDILPSQQSTSTHHNQNRAIRIETLQILALHHSNDKSSNPEHTCN